MQRSPLVIYDALVASGGYLADPSQRLAMVELDRVWTDLTSHKVSGWWAKVRGKEPRPVTGLYLWGGVGRGKTWLMDVFYDSLPIRERQRIHFHRFMARVHGALRLEKTSRDPLKKIAREWSSNYRVLCFDEFFVSDIADAMLLGGLFQALFAQGVTLVATSNVPPDELYREGLQRARFLPAIEALKAHTQCLHVEGDRDFRLRILESAETYLYPLDEHAERGLDQAFERMAGDCHLDTSLEVNSRTLDALKRGDGIIWFSFEELCERPRSTADYIELARAFNTVFLSCVPRLDETKADATRRFIHLVDEFYDRNVKLLISAAEPIDRLYTGERLTFEFLRTTSRLTEMQSTAYLALPHLP